MLSSKLEKNSERYFLVFFFHSDGLLLFLWQLSNSIIRTHFLVLWVFELTDVDCNFIIIMKCILLLYNMIQYLFQAHRISADYRGYFPRSSHLKAKRRLQKFYTNYTNYFSIRCIARSLRPKWKSAFKSSGLRPPITICKIICVSLSRHNS